MVSTACKRRGPNYHKFNNVKEWELRRKDNERESEKKIFSRYFFLFTRELLVQKRRPFINVDFILNAKRNSFKVHVNGEDSRARGTDSSFHTESLE